MATSPRYCHPHDQYRSQARRPAAYARFGTPQALPGYYAERSSYALRVYLPANFQTKTTITVPDLPDPGLPGYDPELAAISVSALEEPVTSGPPITVSGDSISFTPERALTTVLLTATRCPAEPNTGK